MRENLGWLDWFDNETVSKNGTFAIYRNYLLRGKEGESVYEFPQILGTLNWSPDLSRTAPIAKGVTVFFYHGLYFETSLSRHLTDNTDFNPYEIYEIYFRTAFRHLLARHNRKPIPDADEIAEPIILKQHISMENDYLLESDRYFSECYNDEDRILKSKISEYVKGYIIWVTAKYEILNSKHLHNRDVALEILSDKNTGSKKRILNHWTLKNLWTKTDNHYDAVMQKLTSEIYPILDIPFATKTITGYSWNESIDSTKSYLSGFIYTCLLNKWINDKYKSPDYLRIIKNTFDISVDKTPYNSPYSTSQNPDNLYMIPFKDYRSILDL
jgi:hypothetical protein